MRKCAVDLDHVWRWGNETSADLLVVDLGSFGGQMARARAQSSGIRCAIFATDAVDGDDLLLRRPLLSANVVKVLNDAAASHPNGAGIAPQSADFYTRDLGDAPLGSATVAVRTQPANASGAPAEAPARGLDEVLRGEPVELRSEVPWVPKPPIVPSAPSAAPTDSGVAQNRTASPPRKYATREAMLTDTAPRSLRDYIDGDLLGGPMRINLPDMPALALDPKLRVIHTPVSLGALEPYCHATWRLCDWQVLTTGDLNELRATQPAQPYSRLTWLDVLVHSHGQLASHLDPGGTYRLKRWIEIERELSKYFRIASAMLQPTRLHEIAATSGAAMADVFDLVNAYDAIGLIEWQPRARRVDDPKGASGLLHRLRHPFGKS